MIKTLLMCFVLIIGLSACSTASKNKNYDSKKSNINEAYTILYEITSKQKDLDKISVLKDISPAVNPLLKDISKASEKLAKTLDNWTKQNEIQNNLKSLPAFEKQTRKEIEFNTTKKILVSSGNSLEKLLLLKQNEALNYQSHLCQWISQNEKNNYRQQTLQDFKKRFEKLNQRAFDLLSLNQ
ncbi:MAG: hypothetical protein K1X66_01020 [Verrucomicrobiae bacterium]|nr:hypothetical protein [Verrucomicrobiae bacterium]